MRDEAKINEIIAGMKTDIVNNVTTIWRKSLIAEDSQKKNEKISTNFQKELANNLKFV